MGRHYGSLLGLVLGDASGISDAQESLLRRTGTRHVMAVSGLHLGLAAGLVATLCSFCCRLYVALGGTLHWRLIRVVCGAGALLAAWQYAVLAGASIGSQRALWMIGLATVACWLGRRVSGWSLLGGAVSILMYLQPWQITRPGFLLSVGAVAGILGISPLFSRWIPPDWSRPLRWTLQSMSISIGASLGTFPVSAWVFQEWSLVGPLANLWAGPLVSLWIVPFALLGVCTDGVVSVGCWWLAEKGLDLFWSGLLLLDCPFGIRPFHPSDRFGGSRGVLASASLGLVGVGIVLWDHVCGPTVI